MNISNFIKKLYKKSQNLNDFGNSPQENTPFSQDTEESLQFNNPVLEIKTDIMKSRRGDYYFGITGVDPQSDFGKELQSLGYKFRYKRFSKLITQENFDQISQEINNLVPKYNASLDASGLIEFSSIVEQSQQAVQQMEEGEEMSVDDINDINKLDIDPTKKENIH